MSQGADDATQAPAEPAGAMDLTDEQIWNELDAEESGRAADRDDDPEDGATPADDGGEDDPVPSEDDDTTADDDPEDASTGTEDDEKEEAEDPAVKIARLEGELKRDRGQIAALQRKLERSRAKSQTGDSPSGTASERREKIKAVAEEYGDILSPVVEEMEDLQGKLDRFNEERSQAEQQEIDEAVKEQTDLFLQEHPDGFDVIAQNADVFRGWIEDQPKRLRDIFQANDDVITDGAGTALLVAHFKQALHAAANPDPAPETKQLNSKRKHQLAGAQASRAAGRQSAVSDQPPDTDDPDVLWDYWERKEREKERRTR